MPLSVRAKTLMAVEAFVSLLTAGRVAASRQHPGLKRPAAA
jgi:hypothetical protein